jgi:hypothetical protein
MESGLGELARGAVGVGAAREAMPGVAVAGVAVAAGPQERVVGQRDAGAADQVQAGVVGQAFQLTGNGPDLDDALSASRTAVDAVPPNFPKRGMYLSNLSIIHKTRFDLSGDEADLARAIEVGQAALRATRPGPWLAHPLSNLSIAVRTRAELTGSGAGLDEAIALSEAALDVAAAGDPMRFTYMPTLGYAYLARFQHTGDPDDVEAAVRHLQQGVREIPADDPRLGQVSCSLSAAMAVKFSLSGDLADATSAVDAARVAVNAAAAAGPARARYLSNLGGALRARFERVGEIADLDEAIGIVRDAAAISTPLAERVTYANNLGALLQDRYARTADPADLDQAVDAARAAVDMAPAGHPYLPDHQSTLGMAHWLRFGQTHDPADLEKSTEAGRAAVLGASDRPHSRAMFLHNLVNSLLSRLLNRPQRAWKPAELAEVIDTARAAAAAVPADHPNRVGYLLNLGIGLEARFQATGNQRDLADAIACWRMAVGIGSGPASKRLNVARLWGRSAADHGMSGEAEAGFAAAVELLPLQAWRGLRQHTREEVLSARAGLASEAAAWAISNGNLERAVELLELGRNVLWSQLLQLRGDLDDLRREHPGAARRLDALRAVLDQPEAGSAYQTAPTSDDRVAGLAGGRPPAERRYRDEARIIAAHDWDQLVAEVRAIPGYRSFMRAPDFAELTRDIGDRTVVIINVSRYRCDAIAVTSSGVRLIPLPGLTLDAATEQAARYREALSEFGRSGHAEAGDGRDTADGRIEDVLGRGPAGLPVRLPLGLGEPGSPGRGHHNGRGLAVGRLPSCHRHHVGHRRRPRPRDRAGGIPGSGAESAGQLGRRHVSRPRPARGRRQPPGQGHPARPLGGLYAHRSVTEPAQREPRRASATPPAGRTGGRGARHHRP